MITIHSIDTIVSDAGGRGGQLVIADTKIRVSDVVSSHIYRGQSPDALAVNFKLNLGQVYAALAYYYDHKSEVDALQAEANKAQDHLHALAQDASSSGLNELKFYFAH